MRQPGTDEQVVVGAAGCMTEYLNAEFPILVLSTRRGKRYISLASTEAA
jgi:hypothetical protein